MLKRAVLTSVMSDCTTFSFSFMRDLTQNYCDQLVIFSCEIQCSLRLSGLGSKVNCFLFKFISVFTLFSEIVLTRNPIGNQFSFNLERVTDDI